jgi:hypothetical protein
MGVRSSRILERTHLLPLVQIPCRTTPVWTLIRTTREHSYYQSLQQYECLTSQYLRKLVFILCFTVQSECLMPSKLRFAVQHNLLKFVVLVFFVALGGLVVSVLATGPKVRGFKPGRGRWILRVIKSVARLPSEGK